MQFQGRRGLRVLADRPCRWRRNPWPELKAEIAIACLAALILLVTLVAQGPVGDAIRAFSPMVYGVASFEVTLAAGWRDALHRPTWLVAAWALATLLATAFLSLPYVTDVFAGAALAGLVWIANERIARPGARAAHA